MIRIMLLTFAVLGWAWFALSGGASFVPGEHGVTLMAEVKPVAERPVLQRNTLQPRTATNVADPAPKVTSLAERAPWQVKTVRAPDPVTTTPERTRPAPVTPTPDTGGGAPVVTTSPIAPRETIEATEPDPVTSADSDDFAALLTETIRNSAPPAPIAAEPVDNFDPNATMQRISGLGTSLPLGTAMGAATAPEFLDGDVEFRTVTGTRVNLRDGPATSYPVVTQLFEGDEAEVLDQTGDGWVRLRTLDGVNVGWMSEDFLQRSE